MTSGSADFGTGEFAAELTQSRNADIPEALGIFMAQVKTFRHRLAAIPGFRARRIGVLLSILALFVVWIVATRMHWIPRISPLIQIPLMLLIAFGVCRVWSRYYFRVCAGIYQDCHRANRRFRIEPHGILVEDSGIVSSIPWSAISDIVSDDRNLIIHLSPLKAIFLPKAAFENQDVDGFCTEIRRRWTEANS